MQAIVKRLFDLMVSAIIIFLFFPLFVVLYIIVLVAMGFPVFFAQERAGVNGRPFIMYKFRTMKSECDRDGNQLADELRLTSVGKFLRSTSLDEFPQLYNVLIGQMSLVGPRPLYLKYIPRYSARQSRRLEVRPGITGWAQINGRNAINWQKKLELDVWYVENFSMMLDFKILLLTVKKALAREGINQDHRATVDEFTGNN